MNLAIRPLSPDLWPSLENLFCDGAACSRCWCLYWRIGQKYRKRPPRENKAAFCQIAASGSPPGLLALEGDLPVGWCQVGPRADLPWLDQAWRLKRVDSLPVWSVSCFYTRKRYRKRGVSRALTLAALEAARKAGAPALEAYPIDKEKSPSASSTGYVSTFSNLGFETVAKRDPSRPVMRRDFGRRQQRI